MYVCVCVCMQHVIAPTKLHTYTHKFRDRERASHTQILTDTHLKLSKRPKGIFECYLHIRLLHHCLSFHVCVCVCCAHVCVCRLLILCAWPAHLSHIVLPFKQFAIYQYYNDNNSFWPCPPRSVHRPPSLPSPLYHSTLTSRLTSLNKCTASSCRWNYANKFGNVGNAGKTAWYGNTAKWKELISPHHLLPN